MYVSANHQELTRCLTLRARQRAYQAQARVPAFPPPGSAVSTISASNIRVRSSDCNRAAGVIFARNTEKFFGATIILNA